MADTPASHAAPALPRWRHVVLAAWAPVAAAVVLAAVQFDLRYAPSAIAWDALLVLALVAAFRPVVRGPVALWVIGGLLAAVFVLAHAVKLAFLGLPVVAADARSGLALLAILSGWRLALGVGGSVLVVTMLVVAAWPRRGGARFLLLPAAVVVLAVFALPPVADRLLPVDGEGMAEELSRRGGIGFIVTDFRRYRAMSGEGPTIEEVRRALGDASPAMLADSAQFKPRNLHVVLLEAVWDPRQLGHYRYSRDPFDPRFRAVWDQAGQPVVLSPAFGGATANAEFEMLCGLPTTPSGIVFQDVLKRPMPCLPRLLREAGYLTVVHHAYHADYWNRDQVYGLIGFERYRPIGAFRLDEMDGMFLADGSFFRQVEAYDAGSQGGPEFHYLVSLSSHYPFDRDRASRPDRVVVEPAAKLLSEYVNAVSYTTEAFMDYVEKVRARDPEALIVAFGDHAPVLGPSPDPYALSGIPIDADKDVARTLNVLARTPLLVFDGRKGIVPMGEVRMRDLPQRLMALLGKGAPVLPTAAVPTATGSQARYVTLFGHLLSRDGTGWKRCRESDCDEVRALRAREYALRDDLTNGHQYALTLLGVPELAKRSEMTIETDPGLCGLEVANWGPREAVAGTGFNTLADGSHALWMTLKSQGGNPTLQIGQDAAPVALFGGKGSAAFRSPAFLAVPGRYPVRWSCAGGRSGELGEFVVLAPGEPPPSSVPAAPAAPMAPACRVSVASHGPTTVKAGVAFNPLPDGRSALWAKLEPGAQGFSLRVGGRPVAFDRGENLITFVSEGVVAEVLSRPGTVAFELYCGDVVADRFEVRVDPSE